MTARSSISVRTMALLVAFVVVATIALALRVWDLDRIGLNSDESVYTGQAATLIGDENLSRYFSPFRAHPLLMQSVVASTFLATGVNDLVARLVVAIGFGLSSVIAAGALARRMYGVPSAVITMLVMAVVPYHVLLSRQVMLDVPLSLFLTLTVWAAFRYVTTRDARWWFLSAPLAGFAVMTKEVGILIVIALAAAVFWARLQTRWWQIVGWLALLAITTAPFVLTRLLFESHTTGSYLLYEALREPNHEWWYFPAVLWEFLTPGLALLCGAGLVVMAIRRTDADKLLLCWIAVFGVFFQVWPTKLFPYVIAITPPLAIAAAEATRAIGRAVAARSRAWIGAFAAAAIAFASLVAAVPVSARVIRFGTEEIQGPFEADVEVQDFAGSREAAEWIGENTPERSVILTIGPSVGNIISFYGHRDWYALSITQDPRRRNPAYRPIPNPDAAIRTLQVHYAVWDHYSADRSVFYNERLMRYVRKYHGIPVYSVWVEGGRVHTGRLAPPGSEARLVVYDLVGGDPLSKPPTGGSS